MKKATKFAALAVASAMALAGTTAVSAAHAASCSTNTPVTMAGTIKPEIQDQFLAAVKAYNASQNCYTVTSIPMDRNLTFLQNITPMYAAKHAPTIMYTLQEIPDMADKVMDWNSTPEGKKLVGLVSPGLLQAGNVGGKQVGIPSTAEAFGLLYNKAVLDKAGVNPAKIKTRGDLEAAFKAVAASLKKAGVKNSGAIRFSAIWWSLGAHFTNEYFTNAASTHEGRLKVLDAMANGTKALANDPVWANYIATFNLMNKYNQAKPNLTDNEYTLAAADLAAGKTGFWFMGNWAEPTLLTDNPKGSFGIMPVPMGAKAGTYGNDSISVGVPGYYMIDNTQSTAAQRAGATDFLTWLYTSSAGQHFVVDPAPKGMNFIPVYKGTTVKPSTFMASKIASYVDAGKTLEWMNTYFPAGGQNLYGASGQKYMTGKSTAAKYAAELQAAWKGATKTWRGEKVTN